MFSGLFDRIKAGEEKIAVVGLGYVGLPLAIAMAKVFNVTGFDISLAKVKRLHDNIDDTGEVSSEELKATKAIFTDDPSALSDAKFIIVAVPTPVTKSKKPDLSPLLSASKTIGENIKPWTVVVYESTVYPGATEDDCVPVIEEKSGLKCGVDFKVGYSPERINPGDKEHTIDKIIKVVSGQDDETLAIVAAVYGEIITAGIHKASSIKVAEAAKVIENIQRDINIAFMNELAVIFDIMEIDTSEVLKAAGTKWNFLNFSPGLVGGHCIGVDPYYLTSKAQELGYHPQVILAGRNINDDMGKFVAGQVIKHLDNMGKQVADAKVAILGLTFKENVPDIRNSRVPDIIDELKEHGIHPLVSDPLADREEVQKEYGLSLVELADLKNLDAIVLAVSHDEFKFLAPEKLEALLTDGNGVIVDVKAIFAPETFGAGVTHWRL